MKLGFFTAVLNMEPIESVAHWAAQAGFETLELDWGRHVGDPARLPQVVETVRKEGLDVCMVTYMSNLVDPDSAKRARNQETTTAIVDAAAASGVGLVCTFPSRDESISEDDNYRRIADYYGPLAERAGKGNVKVVLENWPGPHNNYLATTPAGWSKLFQLVPSPNLGLNFDPSHLIRIGVDPEAAVRAFIDRVFLSHAKDTEIFADKLQQVGYHGNGWWTYRLPGHGRLDWKQWLGLLKELGFDGVVSIEHEDEAWGWRPGDPVSKRKDGLVEGLRVLRASLP